MLFYCSRSRACLLSLVCKTTRAFLFPFSLYIDGFPTFYFLYILIYLSMHMPGRSFCSFALIDNKTNEDTLLALRFDASRYSDPFRGLAADSRRCSVLRLLLSLRIDVCLLAKTSLLLPFLVDRKAMTTEERSCAHFHSFRVSYITQHHRALPITKHFLSHSSTLMLTDETNSASNVSSSPTKAPTATAVEIQQFIAYLLRVVPLATDLNATSDVDELKRALNEKTSSTEGIRRFLTDPQCAIFLIRVLQQGKGNDQDASF